MAATPRALSPVLLLGAGTGEATCGIVYLAGYLRRHGVEAFVRLFDDDETEEQMRASLEPLLKRVQPRLVGLSFKWFNHLSRGLLLAKVIKTIDPDIRIVVGGNSASYYWRELGQETALDELVLGDGEAPLLALCRGDAQPPNVVTRGADGTPLRAPLKYVQSVDDHDVYYSHFDELFLSGIDQASFSGWVQPGKGCSENCVYCGGTRGMEQAAFGRPTSFLRPVASLKKDHEAIVGRSWQLRYDFAGGTAEFLNGAWQGFDLSQHATTYFLWGVPPPSLIEALATAFGRVYLVLDVGCFSQSQRKDLMKRGLLKPCPTDDELMQTVALCRRYPNLRLEVCAIAGLPHTSEQALKEELPLVERLLELGCDVGCQRLESQPGALVTQHADRFDMISDASSYRGFVSWFARRGHASFGDFPMIRFRAPGLERKVERAFQRVHETIARQKAVSPVDQRTRLVATVAERRQVPLGEWLGSHQVPARLAAEPLTIIRTRDGAGIACSLTVSESDFAHPHLEQGENAAQLLETLGAFDEAKTVDEANARLKSDDLEGMADSLVVSGFLRRA